VAITADEKLRSLRPNRTSPQLKPALDTSTGLFDKLQLDNIKANQRNTYDGKTEFNAVVLRQTIYFPMQEPNPPVLRVRARIPELHAHLPMPRSISDSQIIDLYPEFIAETKDVLGGRTVLPAGSIITVTLVDRHQTSLRYNNGKIKEVLSDEKAMIAGFQEFKPFFKESKSAQCAAAKTALKAATGDTAAGDNKKKPASPENPRKIESSTDNSEVKTEEELQTEIDALLKRIPKQRDPGVLGTTWKFIAGSSAEDKKIEEERKKIKKQIKEINRLMQVAREKKKAVQAKIDCEKTYVVKDFPKDTNETELSEKAGVPITVLRALMKVESRGNPAAIRFEPHWFVGMKHLGSRYRKVGFRPDLLGRIPYTPDFRRSGVSYVRRETNRDAFLRAYALDPRAAIKSSSFGKYQVMGWALLEAFGNDPVKAWESFQRDPNTASDLMLVSWFKKNGAARRYANQKPEPNWKRLSARYNGPGCCGDLPWTRKVETNTKRYHEKLRKAWLSVGGAG